MPIVRSIYNAVRHFSRAEKAAFIILAAVFIVSGSIIFGKIQDAFSTVVPRTGGDYSEGLIGTPRFINPLLASSDTDRDLASLIYSGLMRVDENGNLVPDLAAEYVVSEDGLEYTFTLKQDAVFHDGTKVTSADVAFTVAKAQDAALKSARRATWEGIAVEAPNAETVIFRLTQPYALFLENATLGILPKHIWENVPNEEFQFYLFNTEPVGSGPYQIDKIEKSDLGIPTYYRLKSFDKFALGTPYIDTITFRFYQNENAVLSAFNEGEIDAASSVSPQLVTQYNLEYSEVLSTPLPRVFSVFLNANKSPILEDRAVRKALSLFIDRQGIIDSVLDGYGHAASSPLPDTINDTGAPDRETAIELLEDNGWELNESGIRQKEDSTSSTTLSFTLVTTNVGEFVAVAEELKSQWGQLGADVSIDIHNTVDFAQTVIRPREYQALLFGQVIGRSPDLYAFWHSSQRNDPGLNITGYANITVDDLLEQARATTSAEGRASLIGRFESEIAKDVPAVFLYSPEFIYILPDKIQNVSIGSISSPHDRFASVHLWFIETDKVWNIFVR